jgi:hypothetical protein
MSVIDVEVVVKVIVENPSIEREVKENSTINH